MNKNFLEDLKNKKQKGKPIVVLAPMADVTDQVFRKMIAKYSRPAGPDIFWTEFVSADGLCSPGREVLKKDLIFDRRKEKPILAQIFGSKKENLIKAIELIYELGFDGIDINMGCPDKSIEKQISGAGIIRNPSLARELISEMKRYVDILNKRNKKRFFSFSIKTRIGYNKIEYKDWFPNILDYEPDIFTVHLRTRKEMSLVDAHWELGSEIKSFIDDYCLKRNLKIPFLIFNGDIKNVDQAQEKVELTKCDGIMVGRGVFGTPWFFDNKEFKKRIDQNIKTKKGRENILFRLKIMLEHTKEFEKKMTKIKSFNIMKKHYKAYVNGWDGAKELRTDLMNAKDYKEVKKIADTFIKNKLK